MVSVTEMAVFAPVPGSLSHYGVSSLSTQSNDDSRALIIILASRWVDPALGFAVSI
jgi:amino acid permease